MEFGHRIWKLFSPGILEEERMSPLSTAQAALNLLFELFMKINKDKQEKFLEEWKKDDQAILKALETGDELTLNRLCAKYRDGLF